MSRRYGLTSSERGEIAGVLSTPAIHDLLCMVAERATGEVCGILYGQVDGALLQISDVQGCANRSGTESEFILDLDAVYESMGRQAEQALRMVGIFHSHPDGPPVPSQFDCYYLERTPFVWAIIGHTPAERPSIRYFLNQGGWIREIEAVLVQDVHRVHLSKGINRYEIPSSYHG